eukprot:3451907-Rhodomonas_salina.1
MCPPTTPPAALAPYPSRAARVQAAVDLYDAYVRRAEKAAHSLARTEELAEKTAQSLSAAKANLEGCQENLEVKTKALCAAVQESKKRSLSRAAACVQEAVVKQCRDR